MIQTLFVADRYRCMNRRMRCMAAAVRYCGCMWLTALTAVAATNPVAEIAVTQDLVLEKDALVAARLVVRASHVTIDGNGATLVGPGQTGDPTACAAAGIGILIEGATGVTLKNIRARGFATGLVLRQAYAITVSACDFSDNYHNPTQWWGELPARGGIVLDRVRLSVIRRNRANRVWDGIQLIDADDNLIADNDFSYCSNTGAKLWHSSRNKFLNNNFSYGIRIDRAAGEVHARDSTGVLIESGSDDNYWYRNDITHGGDGVFIRQLNRWPSRGNVFVENDTSYANNNCVESWSPGNTFIRNKANHGSYGFWLGGSDQSQLIGNEVAYNGRTSGYHNAPERNFRHGGIVIVGGSSSHTLIEGNNLHDNNGAGIAFSGDRRSQGRAWRAEHWVIQQNRIANNRFGIWGRWGDDILLAGNIFTNNALGNYFSNVTGLVELPAGLAIRTAPIAELAGPEIAVAAQTARFNAASSRDPQGHPLRFRWHLEGQTGSQSVLDVVFPQPGFQRVGLTVDNGALASLAWKDVLVVQPVVQELGTEGQASRWAGEQASDQDGHGRITFTDDPAALFGSRSLRFTPDPYCGAYATAIYPASRDAAWNFSAKHQIRFWIKVRNPNLRGWKNAGPVVRLLGWAGQIEYTPAKNANLISKPPYSEAQWTWMPVTIPLAGDVQWQRTTTGQASLDYINAISLSLDSQGGDPFTVWLDGLTVE
ncbi:MAG: right-handed parallel beta-helix repeat-containing protein [bacterium]|nr:right-handed parallel beta-helix repeat-containing protein [bacterium]